MIVGKFEPSSFFQRADNVALNVAASEIFGWLNRTMNLPPQWAALVTKSTGAQEAVRPGGTVDGTDAESVLFVRTSPVDVYIEQPGLASQDGFSYNAEIRARLTVIPDGGELVSFQRNMLGSRRVAQAAGLANLLQPAVATALAQVVSQKPAAEIVESLAHDDIVSAVAEAVKEVCFSAGLALERMPVVKFDSSAYREVREVQQRAASARAEHAAAQEVQHALTRARSQHLEHLSEALVKLKELAAASPAVALADLIRTFTERQRGEIYEALFAADAPVAQTAWIVAAAGNELLFFRPGGDDSPSRRLRIEGSAGPTRSIQATRDPELGYVLLIGAATGVHRWPIDRAAPDLTLLVPGAPTVRGGFNSVAAVADRVYAAHSELGIWEWPAAGLGDMSTASPVRLSPRHAERSEASPGLRGSAESEILRCAQNDVGSQPMPRAATTAPRRRLESLTKSATTIRCLTAHGGDIFVAIDDQIVRFRPAEDVEEAVHIYTGSDSAITAVCPTDDGMFAGNAEGDVLHWPRGAFTGPQRVHTGMRRPAESIGAIGTHGLTRLVFTDTSPRVHAVVLGDSFRCEYQAGGQTLRRVDVAPDLLVATNDLRDRLFLWRPGKPAEPHETIAVSRLCGHSIQDVCLVPA